MKDGSYWSCRDYLRSDICPVLYRISMIRRNGREITVKKFRDFSFSAMLACMMENDAEAGRIQRLSAVVEPDDRSKDGKHDEDGRNRCQAM